jgi:hypothetical protein
MSGGISLGLQLDILKVLKMTMFSYEFSFKFENSSKAYLNFPQQNLLSSNDENDLNKNINLLIQNKKYDLGKFKSYLISEEIKSSQELKSKYNFFFFGVAFAIQCKGFLSSLLFIH